jgi:hypothetical protein
LAVTSAPQVRALFDAADDDAIGKHVEVVIVPVA